MYSQQSQTNTASLNKRRRFAPGSLSATPFEYSVGMDQAYDTPLLLELCEQSPSQQEIEAQLLQVGMRIRKSVNDGYQTPGRRAFTPRPFMNFSRLSPETQSALSNDSSADTNSSVGGMSKMGAPLNTATFCGINLAMMSHISSTPAIEEQKLWSYSTASKRRQQFEDDSDSEDSQEFMPATPQLEYADARMIIPQDYFNIRLENMGNFSGNVSPVFQENVSRPNTHNRKIAQPRLRHRTVPEQTVPAINPFAQIAPPRTFGGHQRMRSCGMEALDFGEASFLQPRQDVDMDCS